MEAVLSAEVVTLVSLYHNRMSKHNLCRLGWSVQAVAIPRSQLLNVDVKPVVSFSLDGSALVTAYCFNSHYLHSSFLGLASIPATGAVSREPNPKYRESAALWAVGPRHDHFNGPLRPLLNIFVTQNAPSSTDGL